MADHPSGKTPLLSDNQLPSSISLDDAIEQYIGHFGWSQLLQAFLISLVWIFDSQQCFISIFTDAQPTWHCTTTNSSCNSQANICLLPTTSWAWDSPAHASIVSEWSLQCTNSIIMGLPASSFYLGCFSGGIFLSTLADSTIGRKKMLLLSSLLMSVAGLLAVFSTNIWVYSILRFVSGFGRANIGSCALVLTSELFGEKWRNKVNITALLHFPLGYLSLPVIAYINKGSSWRVLYLWISIPTVLYCVLVYFFLCESPRWLFLQGRKEEFVTTLKKMAPSKEHDSLTNVDMFIVEQKSNTSVDLYSAFKMLLEKRWALRRLIALTVLGFGVGIVYYGVSLGVGNLNFDLYLSSTLNGLFEIPAIAAIYFIIGKFNRRSTLLAFTTISGICSLMCVVKWRDVQIVMELVSFFCACTAFDVLLLYALELFPTCVRNSAVSILRLALVFGGVFSPLLVSAGRENGWLSYGVFGLTVGICGIFVMCLPETRGGRLCDTMEEEEQKEMATAATTHNKGGVGV